MAVDDRWVRGLHNLYLVALLIAVLASTASVASPTPLPARLLWPAVALLVAADLVVRRWPVGRITAYFLVVAAVLGALTALLPAFATVAFGILPLAFVRLRWPAAVAVGVLVTGSPYLIRPYAIRWSRGDGAPAEMMVRFGPGYLIVVGVALPVLIGLFTAAVIGAVHRQSRASQAVVAQLSATRAQLAAASRQAGRAEERQRLAHELHDTLAQGLSGVILQLEAAEQQLDLGAPQDGTARLERLLSRARHTARACLADTRRAVEALRPEPLDAASLSEAVAEVCRQWTDATGVPARLTVRGRPRGCPPRLEVAALRVLQEALANAGKHAAAGEVTVTLDYGTAGIRLEVSDDGRGFDPAHPPPPDGYTSGGLGLVTIEERVAALRGTVAVTSAPGSGTTVTATLPEGRP